MSHCPAAQSNQITLLRSHKVTIMSCTKYDFSFLVDFRPSLLEYEETEVRTSSAGAYVFVIAFSLHVLSRCQDSASGSASALRFARTSHTSVGQLQFLETGAVVQASEGGHTRQLKKGSLGNRRARLRETGCQAQPSLTVPRSARIREPCTQSEVRA